MKQIKFTIAIVILLACTTFFVATPRNVQAAPLHASWSFEDDLESDIGPWSCWGAGGYCTTVSTLDNVYFILRANINGSIVNMGRRVTISTIDHMSCKATMYIKRNAGSAPFTGQLEVIQYNTLNYVSIKPFSFTPLPAPFNNQWTAVTTSSWTPPGQDLFIRLVLNNNTQNPKELQIDLLRVNCTW